MARKRTKLNALSSIGMPGHCFASPWRMIHTRHILLFVRMPAVWLQKPFEAFGGRGQELAAQCFGAGGGDQFPEDNTPPLPVVDLPVSPGYADLLQPGLPQSPGADRRKIHLVFYTWGSCSPK